VSNRIRGTEGNPVEGNSSRGVERVRAMASPRTVTTGSDQPTDSVHITDTARAVLAMQAAIASVPDVDTARVEQLRLSIDQQKYQVNAGKIADRLMSLEGELLAASQDKKY
jgi:negative regulator of flagellin synthesis FlgM